MAAEALTDFKDLREGVMRRRGERFEVTAERFREINATGYGKLVREVRAHRGKKE